MEYNEKNTKWGKTGQTIRKVANSDEVRGLSSALIGSAYRDFGRAFEGGGYTPRGQKPDTSYLNKWNEAGDRAQKQLEHRWYQAEFKNFRKNYLDKFQADMQTLGDKMGHYTKELEEGRWQESDGSITPLDYNNPVDRAKGNRLKGMIETEAMERMTELQINLNNSAAEKYGENPIIDKMIQQMMEGQTQSLASQFNQPNTNAQQTHEMNMRKGEADIARSQSLTRQTDSQTAKSEAAGPSYKTADAAFAAMGPAGSARYFANTTEGKALLAGTRHDDFLKQMTQLETNRFIKKNDWKPGEIAQHEETITAHLNTVAPDIYQRATHKWMEYEYGKDAADAAGAERKGLLPTPGEGIQYDVDVMPSKKVVKEKADKWAALGLVAANQAMREDSDMDKSEAEKWLMEKWLPAALNGETPEGNLLEETAGLTANAEKKEVQPYLKAVRAAIQDTFKFIGSGPDTDNLRPEQRSQPHGPRRGRGHGAGGRNIRSFLDKITPDGLLKDDVYSPDFKKQFPEEDE